MNVNNKSVVILCACFSFVFPVLAECPPADLTGDCFVDIADFAEFASQWMTGTRTLSMVLIPGGTFQMGKDGNYNEEPVHSVTLNSFYMGKYEITNGQYCDFLNSALMQGLVVVDSNSVYRAGFGLEYPYCITHAALTGSQIVYDGSAFSVNIKGGRNMANDPMVMVSWYGAVAYCNWRSQLEGKEECYDLSAKICNYSKHGYRLPSEAEWEYAARGGLDGKLFPWGDTISHNQANYYSYWIDDLPYYPYDENPTKEFNQIWNDGIEPYTSPVGSFAQNGYGLYDMAGNTIEWCNDSSSKYSSEPQTNPTGPQTGTYRIHRGGSWDTDANMNRVAARDGNDVWKCNNHDGFRIVLPEGVK